MVPPGYDSGISQPPNGTILASRARWAASRGERRSVGPAWTASVSEPSCESARAAGREEWPADRGEGSVTMASLEAGP